MALDLDIEGLVDLGRQAGIFLKGTSIELSQKVGAGEGRVFTLLEVAGALPWFLESYYVNDNLNLVAAAFALDGVVRVARGAGKYLRRVPGIFKQDPIDDYALNPSVKFEWPGVIGSVRELNEKMQKYASRF